ncbi:LOW QUALITY PROTEIN: hypothetical protein RJ639_035020 [Escallonia herrerae]|uniref:Fungal lipase-type domain-containing protein n=1 Tax=Escallonia herrerae TaxID=1293975 RepID=A0AA89BC35_9ASTE|nr:LOW QUALITY PROTEIN: hypothetical protein RJ639_035020 [Escallonia herrerae]
MACYRPMKRVLLSVDLSVQLLKRHDSYRRFVYNFLNRYQSQWSKAEKVEPVASKEAKDTSQVPLTPKVNKRTDSDPRPGKFNSEEVDTSSNKWKLELAWLAKALEPALQVCRWALPTGNGFVNRPPLSSRSLAEIVASIQRSKLGLQDWSLSDLTIGLYLMYLRQASTNPFEDAKGIKISSDKVVQDLIYHTELAKGTYKDSTAGLAKHSMLRESNVVKFVKNSSVLRPGYYIGIDTRSKLVVLGIRGTHTVYDLITDIISSSSEEITLEGYSSHFGTAESARWFLIYEMVTIRKCLEKHKVAFFRPFPFFLSVKFIVLPRLNHPQGFRLRLVGHSLGGATAALLATMLRKKSIEELGFSPDIVSAVGFGTPPCVSKELAESCSDYVTTIVMQDDIIPRLSGASLTRLRNEILQTDWTSIFEKRDWGSVVDLVTNAKQVASSVQGVARKLADYAKFRSQTKFSDIPIRKESLVHSGVPLTSKPKGANGVLVRKEGSSSPIPELFVPGTVYYLKRDVDTLSGNNGDGGEVFTLWKRDPGEHFQRILLSVLSLHEMLAAYGSVHYIGIIIPIVLILLSHVIKPAKPGRSKARKEQ